MIPIYLGLCVAALVTAAVALATGVALLGDSAAGAAAEGAKSSHQLLGLSACVLLLLVQCAVFVYFLGTGKAVKTAVELRGLDPELARETRSLKGKTFPFATFSALAVVAGAVLAGAAAPTTHAIAMLVALALTGLAIPFELRAIRRNHDLMNRTDTALERKETDLVASGESLADPDAAPPAFVLGRLLVVAGVSVWLVFAYRAVVMRGHPEPWPWYVVVSLGSLAIGIPMMLSASRRTARPAPRP
jgi:hypothetical protein